MIYYQLSYNNLNIFLNFQLILLKKKLNQAKIQIIRKLTRKAKSLVEKKAPEPLKEKFKQKAECAIKEVLITKVIIKIYIFCVYNL